MHGSNLPSKLRRLFSIALYCFGPLGMSSAIGNLKKYISNKEAIREEAKEQIVLVLETVQAILPQVTRLNISAFFLGSAFYHLSKRLTGIKYAQLDAFGERGGLAAPSSSSYKLLGTVCLVNAAAATCHTAWSKRRSAKVSHPLSRARPEKGASSPASAVRSCVLCLDAMQSPSCCSTCGHVFCWTCILESLAVNAECPLCRVRTEPRQVVALMNYE